MKELIKRKNNRMEGYDYSQNGAYFVTICAKERAEIFAQIVGVLVKRPSHNFQQDDKSKLILSEIGRIIEEEIATLQIIRSYVTIDHYVIMPNHVHML